MFMVKTILFEVYQLMSSKEGNYQDSNGVIERILSLYYGESIRERYTKVIINNLKVESGQPKNILRTDQDNLGLPKGSNPYGNRAVVVPLDKGNVLGFGGLKHRQEGRTAAKTLLKVRGYCTGSTKVKSKIAKDLGKLYERSRTNKKKVIDRNLYKILCDKEALLKAYQKLKSKPGSMTPGVVPETLNGMSNEVLDK